MEAHLSETQLFESFLGGRNPAAEAHLTSCPECRAQLERLRSATTALRDSAHAQAEQREGFWARQRSSAAARNSERAVRPLAWTAAVAAAVLAAMLLQEPRPVAPVTPATDPDHALMLAVQRAVNREVPKALEPAALLTQEISRNVKPNGPSRQSKGESQ